MKSKVIEGSKCRLWLQNEILYVVYYSHVDITLEDAKITVAKQQDILNGKKLPLFVDISQILSIEKNARTYFSTIGSEDPLAVALLVKTPLSKMIGNFFIGLNKTICPSKLFTTEREAISWLNGYKSE